ncbi:ABC transporter substrate-binding protein [Streptomyces albipurpureus]|uniref:ABC transporter substrate-binding protein n=1 Tax=Streptomyces albipurpureus TaxID=2897419 RepID=A0ABT0UGM1_9ACTN|nr:ABC transporter substrate-binding protein [Streptomyces sp. CWNU-1]MCM2387588.1 ABC transporter substrate-binding protein [Streptomyces sp. CWNU-1]
MNRSRAVSAAGLATLLLGVTACGTGDDDGATQARTGDYCKPLAKTEKVTFGATPSLAFGTPSQAEGGGHYKSAKLEVKTSTFSTGQDVIALVGRGQLDAAMVGFPANIFSAIDQGVDVRIVSSAGQMTAKSPTTVLFVRSDLMKKGTVSKISDLKGLRIGMPGGPGSAAFYVTGQGLEKGGLKLSDVKNVTLAPADMLTALQTKSIDAALVTAPFDSAVEKSGVAQPLDTQGALVGLQTGGIIMGPNLLKKRPEVGCAFLKAHIEAARKELAPGYSKNPKTVDSFVELGKFPRSLVETTPEYAYDDTLTVDKDKLNGMQSLFIEQGSLELKSPLAYGKVVDVPFRDQVVRSLGEAPAKP